MNTTQTKTAPADLLEPGYWSNSESREIDSISEALSTLPDSILSSIEAAFRILESGSTLKPESPYAREAGKMVVATQVARCL